jgi:hypothetical protein
MTEIKKEITKHRMIKMWLEHILAPYMFKRIPLIKSSSGMPMGNGYTAMKKFMNAYLKSAHKLWLKQQNGKLRENQYFLNSLNAYPEINKIAWFPNNRNRTQQVSSIPRTQEKEYYLSKVGLIYGINNNIPPDEGSGSHGPPPFNRQGKRQRYK